MILEVAELHITPGQADDFESAFATAKEHIAASAGCEGVELRRCVEVADKYLLLVRWRTLADHMDGFRNSDAFPKWRAAVGPFFAKPPVVEHFELVAQA